MMKIRQLFQKWMLQEDLNFLLTNRIPRITLTRFMGWWSQIRHPWVVKSSMAVWRMFSDLDLSDAKHQKFDSLHACFTRELRPGARVVNPDPAYMTSPCDAIVGACGTISQGQVYQAKGFPYQLQSLLGTSECCQHWPSVLEGGSYLTLRLTSSMYHRFHAPYNVHLEHVTYISGDTWNVNPVALKRVQALFCKNERAVLHMKTQDGVPFLMVPVAAVLVASMRFHAVDVLLNLRYKGPNEMPCGADYVKGQEMGWFEHGSTILVFLPPGFAWADGIANGERIQMGQALFKKLA
ncbi:archaetidylserine decarboxylase [Limnohabitans sp. 15K]|uniref:archaetidylserine decarboxylase n=1 Tax=Limnohabitans sp. 15K TaxID=1100706 RepID=UPI001E4916BB|nr:archaetidylserine decarboxylase [Limnohabitans sp. 15K]